jgi:outer membrane receptor protein involved in Fe transport
MRSGLCGSLLTAIAAASLALPIVGFAQSVDAVLRGHAPPNSQVTAKNVTTGAVRRTSVNADGLYTLVGLQPGTYRVDAGSGTEQTVTVTIASTAILDLSTGGSAATEGALEEIVVNSKRLVDVKTSEVGSGVSLHQIETTPQITRNFLEFADAVPGIVFQVDAKGNTQLRSGAQYAGATNVYIDGVGQKNYVRGSGITGQAGANANQNPIGDPGNPFPQLAIGEYKVITSNYKAEYDQISGAALTAVTKSGTNEFHGEVFGTYTSGSMRAETPPELFSSKGKQGGPSKEFGFAVGGPIIMDQLHYFFTYEGKQFTTPNSVRPPEVFYADTHAPVPVASWLTPELRAIYGPVANPFKEDLYFGKLDWEISDADRLEFTAKYRRERQVSGAEGIIAQSAATQYTNDENRYQLRWENRSGNRFNEATATYEKTIDTPSKTGSDPGRQYVVYEAKAAGFDPILQTDGVDPRNTFFTAQHGFSLQDDLTVSDLKWQGEHTLKTGVKFKDVTLEDRDAGTAPLYSYYVDPIVNAGPETIPLQVVFGAQGDPNLPTISTSKDRQFGVYFQDDWSPTEHLQFNLGVRYDYEQTPGYTDYVTPRRFVDAINGPDTNFDFPKDPTQSAYYWDGAYHGAAKGQTYRQTLAKAGINIDDYISNGHNRKNPSNEIAPRFGVSYDLTGDQRHVVFGAAGRSYDRNTWGIMQHESNKATLYTPTIQFLNANNPNCNSLINITATCVPWNNAYLTQAGLQSIAPSPFGDMHFINNNIKAPYSDQFSVGIRNKLGDWNTSVTVARILGHDGLIASSGFFFGDGTWYWFDQGAPFYGYAGSGGLVNTPNGKQGLYLFDNAKETRTTQVLVSFEKPYTAESRWSMSIAYTYSDAKEKLGSVNNGDYQFDYAHLSQATFVTSGDVAKQRLVMTGSIDVPWGIILGGKLVVETPKGYTNFDIFVPTAVANGLNQQYLKTTTYPKQKLGYRDIDLQLTKSFALPGKTSVDLRLDLLNVFNYRNYAILQDGYPDLRSHYDVNGDLAGVPRTVKGTINVKF